MPETARWIGCNTILRDEVEGSLNAKWGGTYDMENYVIGVATVVVILLVLLWLIF